MKDDNIRNTNGNLGYLKLKEKLNVSTEYDIKLKKEYQ
jgi:hypothetical protein